MFRRLHAGVDLEYLRGALSEPGGSTSRLVCVLWQAGRAVPTTFPKPPAGLPPFLSHEDHRSPPVLGQA